MNHFIEGIDTQNGFKVASFAKALDTARLVLELDRFPSMPQ